MNEDNQPASAKIDGRKTEASRAEAHAQAQWTPEARARMVASLSPPEVREKIRQGTRRGMAAWRARQLEDLRTAWAKATCPQVRKQFRAEIDALPARSK